MRLKNNRKLEKLLFLYFLHYKPCKDRNVTFHVLAEYTDEKVVIGNADNRISEALASESVQLSRNIQKLRQVQSKNK